MWAKIITESKATQGNRGKLGAAKERGKQQCCNAKDIYMYIYIMLYIREVSVQRKAEIRVVNKVR